MKPICIILAFALLLPGCYSEYVVTKDDSVYSSSKDVTFLLTDGRSIESSRWKHRRVANGYMVVGKVNTNQDWRNFDGMVRDEEIMIITVRELDAASTAIGIGIGVVVVVGVAAAIILTTGIGFN